jgi:two-component system, cell cycle sensor histidine kinase DivJ
VTPSSQPSVHGDPQGGQPPAVWAGLAGLALTCVAAVWAVRVPGGSADVPWPLLLAGAGLLAFVILAGPLRRRSGETWPLLALAVSGLALALAGGGLASPAFLAVLWPVLAARALRADLLSGAGLSLAAALGAGWLGPLLAQGGPLVPMLWNAALAAIVALLLLAASLMADKQRRGGQGDSLALPAASSETASLRQIASEALTEAEIARADATGRARFMAEMSHEIRTPLNHILGFSDTMRQGVFGPLPGPYAEYAGLIHQSGSHLMDMVSDLLDLSKVDAGRFTVAPEPLDLRAIGSEAVRLSSATARATGVQLREEAGQPVLALADPRAVRQIAFNLISNAIKFTPEGGRVQVRVAPEAAGSAIRFEVADTGVGMTAEQLAKVGEPYASTAGLPKGMRGTGLGLTLVRRLAEMQGGRFEIASVPGEGTIASVILPAAPAV